MKSTKGSTSNAQTVIGEKGQEGKPKGQKNHQKKEPKKLDNATNDETYHHQVQVDQFAAIVDTYAQVEE